MTERSCSGNRPGGDLDVLAAAGRLGPDVPDLDESSHIVEMRRIMTKLRRRLEIKCIPGTGMLEQERTLREVILAKGRAEARQERALPRAGRRLPAGIRVRDDRRLSVRDSVIGRSS